MCALRKTDAAISLSLASFVTYINVTFLGMLKGTSLIPRSAQLTRYPSSVSTQKQTPWSPQASCPVKQIYILWLYITVPVKPWNPTKQQWNVSVNAKQKLHHILFYLEREGNYWFVHFSRLHYDSKLNKTRFLLY